MDKLMRDEEDHCKNLHLLSVQEGAPLGYISIETAADLLVIRDELIRDLKRVIEDDARARLSDRRSEAIAKATPARARAGG